MSSYGRRTEKVSSRNRMRCVHAAPLSCVAHHHPYRVGISCVLASEPDDHRVNTVRTDGRGNSSLGCGGSRLSSHEGGVSCHRQAPKTGGCKVPVCSTTSFWNCCLDTHAVTVYRRPLRSTPADRDFHATSNP